MLIDHTVLKQDERPKVRELTEEELKALYGRIDDNQTKEDAELIKNSIKFTFWIQKKFKETGITLSKLKSLIFGSKSEKSDKKNDEDGDSDGNKGNNEENRLNCVSSG